jgi:hypothetical protein
MKKRNPTLHLLPCSWCTFGDAVGSNLLFPLVKRSSGLWLSFRYLYSAPRVSSHPTLTARLKYLISHVSLKLADEPALDTATLQLAARSAEHGARAGRAWSREPGENAHLTMRYTTSVGMTISSLFSEPDIWSASRAWLRNWSRASSLPADCSRAEYLFGNDTAWHGEDSRIHKPDRGLVLLPVWVDHIVADPSIDGSEYEDPRRPLSTGASQQAIDAYPVSQMCTALETTDSLSIQCRSTPTVPLIGSDPCCVDLAEKQDNTDNKFPWTRWRGRINAGCTSLAWQQGNSPPMSRTGKRVRCNVFWQTRAASGNLASLSTVSAGAACTGRISRAPVGGCTPLLALLQGSCRFCNAGYQRCADRYGKRAGRCAPGV